MYFSLIAPVVLALAASGKPSLANHPELRFLVSVDGELKQLEATAASQTFALGDNRFLRLRKWPAIEPARAKMEIKSRVELLNQYLAKQIDPYIGEASVESACKLSGAAQKLDDSAGEVSQLLTLVASPAFAIDCYGNAPNRRNDHRQLIYCKTSQSLFEIDLYFPLGEKRKMQKLAVCR